MTLTLTLILCVYICKSRGTISKLRRLTNRLQNNSHRSPLSVYETKDKRKRNDRRIDQLKQATSSPSCTKPIETYLWNVSNVLSILHTKCYPLFTHNLHRARTGKFSGQSAGGSHVYWLTTPPLASVITREFAVHAWTCSKCALASPPPLAESEWRIVD